MPNKTYGELFREGQARLAAESVPDADFDARCLLSHAAGCALSALRMLYTDAADEDIQNRFAAYLARRASGEPLQYILGEWDFYDMSFTVREGALIPRPETEFLSLQAIRLLPKDGVLYDVCAGTGCVGLSAAMHRPDVQVLLFEKYDGAFAVLQDNMQRHALPNVRAVRRDMFLGVPDGLPLPDGIVSNPPYIVTDELSSLQREVQYEPRQALDGGADGLRFYRALREMWFPLLKENGFLCMECGEDQPSLVAAMFKHTARIDPDLTGTPRFVTILKEKTERQEDHAS